MNFDDRIPLNIFKGETTYSNDYRKYPFSQEVEDLFRSELVDDSFKNQKVNLYKPTCHETFTELRENVHIPFDLFWRKTSPDSKCKTLKPVDLDKEESIKTRPRLYIAPAVSIDDIDCKASRDLLIKRMYTTDFRRAEREAALPLNYQNNNDNNGAHEFVIKDHQNLFNKNQSEFPELPKGLRENCIVWDKSQKRAFTNPTISFWKNKDPPVKCTACDNIYVKGAISEECRKKINNLIETNMLNRQYDRLCPGYAGYKMKNAMGVPMQVRHLPIHHPLRTTQNQVTKRYENDLIEARKKKH